MNAPHNTLYQIAQMVPLNRAKWLPDLKLEKIFEQSSGPLVEIQNNFTEILLVIPYTKNEQIVLLG